MFHVKHTIKKSALSDSEKEYIFDQYNSILIPLMEYTDQLLWWNSKINLLSRDVSRETIELHLLHSLAAGISSMFKGAASLVDAGTGGGLPGIPLAIANPEKNFLLNDIVAKKITAVKQIVRSLKIGNVKAAQQNIATITPPDAFTVISKHAFKIPDILTFLDAKKWDGILLLKGYEDVESEISGMSHPLNIHITTLEGLDRSKTGFFDGKGLVEIYPYEQL